MMTFKFINKLFTILFFLICFLITKEAKSDLQAALADTVQVTIPDTSVGCGDTVIIPVSVDDVSGKEIYSFQMVLTFDGDVLTADSAYTTGAITQVWGIMPTYNPSSGQIYVAMAGMSALSGSGTLVYVVFTAGTKAGDTTTIHFNQMLFNEGDPPAKTQDELFSISPCLFQTSVLPDSQEICSGDGAIYKIIVTSSSETCDSCQFLSLSIEDLPCGASFDFEPDSVMPTDSSTLAIMVPDTCSAGTCRPIVIADDGAKPDTTEITLVVVEPDFSMDISPKADTVCAGDSTTYVVNITSLNMCSDSVNLTLNKLGFCDGVTTEFDSETVIPTDSSVLVVHTSDVMDASSCSLEVAAQGKSFTYTDTITLVVKQRDFSLEIIPDTDSLCTGDSVIYKIRLFEADCFDSLCSLQAQILPDDSGLTSRFETDNLIPTDSTDLIITSDSSAPARVDTIVITSSGGGRSHIDTVLLSVNSKLQAPSNVVDTIITDIDPNGIKICWDPVVDASGYIVFRDIDVTLDTLPSDSLCYLHSDPSTGPHCYTVSALNLCGESPRSDPPVCDSVYELSGKAMDDLGQGIGNIFVYVESDTSGAKKEFTGGSDYILDSTLTSDTDDTGHYSFKLPVGSYRVFIDSTVDVYQVDLDSDTMDLNFTGSTGVDEPFSDGKAAPSFALLPNYPNPFNPNTIIEYKLPHDCRVEIAIYNVLGQKVKTLTKEWQTAGCKKVIWDGKNQKRESVTSGVYFYKIKADEFTQTKKMVILR